jgi:hypothetical protein
MRRKIGESYWRSVCAVVALVGGLVAATPAIAQDGLEDEQPRERLGLSIGLAAGVRWMQLPAVQAGLVQSGGSPEPYGASPDTALGWGIDGFLGYALGDDAALVGKAAGITLRVRTAIADDLDSQLMPPGLYGQMPVDGSGVSNGRAGGIDADSSVSFARYDVDVVYRTQVDFDAPVRLRPLVGLAYSRVDQDHSFQSAPFNGFLISDELGTNSIGGVLGVETVFELPFDLHIDLAGEADLLAAISDLAVTQDFGGVAVSASADRTDFVWRLRGQLGFGWTWNEMLSVGLSGTADWGRVPTVVHPLYDSMPFESFVDHDESLVVGGNLTFSVVF